MYATREKPWSSGDYIEREIAPFVATLERLALCHSVDPELKWGRSYMARITSFGEQTLQLLGYDEVEQFTPDTSKAATTTMRQRVAARYKKRRHPENF